MANFTKSKGFALAKKYLILTLGCLVLAFGSAAFISPLGLVTGGVLSIGVIIQHFIYLAGSDFYAVDIITGAAQVVLLLISFLVLGKKYTIRTIYTSLLYPLLFSLFTRVQMIDGLSLGNYICRLFDPADFGQLILAALAGGVLVGIGVATCYHAGGSTGGLDVICTIIARNTPVKEAAASFTLDATLVLIGVIATRDVRIALVGVIGAFACALAIQYVYVNAESFIIADIISVEYEKIQEYVHKNMDHATTVIDVTGGYSGEGKKLIRVAFSSRELFAFRDYIGTVDPRAFVTFTKASMINGEGFDPLVRQKTNQKDQDLHG